jgi:hypothetical protein
MVSVYYHAHRKSPEYPESPPDEQLPSVLRPAQLSDAATVIMEADDEHAESRRRRAIVQLTKSPIFSEQSGREALEILEAPISTLIGLKEATSDLAEIYETVSDAMGALGTPALYETRKPTLALSFDPSTLVTDIKVSIQVKRDFGEVVKTLDPRTWSHCSDYFEASYIAEKVDGLAQIDEDYDAVKSSEPEAAIGSSYDALLFEHFHVPLDFGLPDVSWLRNILKIKFESGPTSATNTYELRRSIASRIYLDQRLGGIDVDRGYATATPEADGWVYVEGKKQLRFTDRTPGLDYLEQTWLGFDLGEMMNYFTPYILAASMDDALIEGVSCSI